MGRCFHRAPALVLLTAACMLTACGVKAPPTAIAEVSQPSAPSPPEPKSEVSEPAPEQPIETLSTEAPMLPPDAKATTRFVSDPSARRLLRWKFAVGDVFRYETSLVEKLTIGDEEFRNERLVRFRWTVFDVGDDGSASILVAFDRVRLDFEQPRFTFDSDKFFSDFEPSTGATMQRELQAARCLLGSELVVEVNARGEHTVDLGADNAHEFWRASHFSPAGFSALPDEPVGPGDSWRVPIAVGESVLPSSGYTDGLVRSEQSVGGRAISVIECSTKMIPLLTAVSRFDATAGRFLSRTSKSASTMRTGAGQEARTIVEVKQQLLPDSSDQGPSLQELVAGRYSQITEFPLDPKDVNRPSAAETSESLKRPPYAFQQKSSSTAGETEQPPRKRRGPVER